LLLDQKRPAPSAGQALPQLDALRGVAILAVFAQHLGDRFLPLVRDAVERRAPAPLVPWILTALHHAWWGVDLFFVLSGFSLALSAIRARTAPRPGPFLLRRAARILPAYYVALAVTLAVHHATLTMPGFPASLVAHLLVLQGYVAPGNIVIIGAAWSLTTEACFYLLFAFLARPLCAPGRAGVRLGVALVLGAWITRFVLHEIVLQPGTLTGLLEATQRRWITSRLDQFILGVLAARAFVALESAPRAARLAPFALALTAPLLLLAFRLEGAFYLDPLGAWPYALLSLVTAGIVLSASLCKGLALRVIAPRPLSAVGLVSYGVFLFHQLALGMSDLSPFSPPTWGNFVRTALLGLASALFAGYLSWTLVELPALRWAGKKREKNPAIQPDPSHG
jgi:peptidoglycan/LPS O-acetylase OafA/YrhL